MISSTGTEKQKKIISEEVKLNNKIQDLVLSIVLTFLCMCLFFHCLLERSIDGKVRNYDIRLGQLRADCIGQPVTSVSFTRDGQCVLASTLDDTIHLLDKDTGELLNE